MLFPSSYAEELSTLTGEQGGRVLLQAHSDRVLPYPVSHPYELLDVDTYDDFLMLEPINHWEANHDFQQ